MDSDAVHGIVSEGHALDTSREAVAAVLEPALKRHAGTTITEDDKSVTV